MYFCVFYHSSCLRDSSDCVMNMRRCLHLRVESPGWWMNSETNWISWCVLNLTSLWRWSSVRWSILTETQDQDHSTDRRRAVGLCCPSVIRWSRAGTLNQNHFLICAVSVTEADSGSADGNNSPADTRPTLKMHRGLQCACVCVWLLQMLLPVCSSCHHRWPVISWCLYGGEELILPQQ